jgi:1-acyl-sn-glycerol-3-phosphate acyltransferase
VFLKLFIQKIICYITFIFLYPTTWIWVFVIKRYKINNLYNLRKEFQLITKKINGPLLICPNHLTYIDSVLLLFVFGSLWNYMCKFNTLAWNFPKIDHVKHNVFYKSVCYLSKCIFVDANTIEKAKYLLSNQEYVLLFPEGHRSVNGLVDTNNFAYGVGKLVASLPNINILCVYLRGSTQKVKSNFPNAKDSFYCKLNLMIPEINNNNLRTHRLIARNIINNLAQMEQEYLIQYAAN